MAPHGLFLLLRRLSWLFRPEPLCKSTRPSLFHLLTHTLPAHSHSQNPPCFVNDETSSLSLSFTQALAPSNNQQNPVEGKTEKKPHHTYTHLQFLLPTTTTQKTLPILPYPPAARKTLERKPPKMKARGTIEAERKRKQVSKEATNTNKRVSSYTCLRDDEWRCRVCYGLEAPLLLQQKTFQPQLLQLS